MIRVNIVDNDCENIAVIEEIMGKYFFDFAVKYEIDTIDCNELISPRLWAECAYDLAVFNISNRLNRSRLLEYSVEIRRLCRKTKVIFISDELCSVLDIFDYEPNYFIYKPQIADRLIEAMEHLLKLEANKGTSGLVLSTKSARHIIPQAMILYMEHYQHKTKIVCEGEELICHEKLSTLLEQLDVTAFVRCHCSFVANLEHVRKYTRTQLLMSNGDILPCSRSNQKKVREILENSRRVKD